MNASAKKHRWSIAERGEPARPFRLYDARSKRNVRWRCYGSELKAHLGAIEELWVHGEVGDSYEVYDVRHANSLGTYTKRLKGLSFLGSENIQARLLNGGKHHGRA